MYPLSMGLPLILSLTVQVLLWAGTLWHIEWLNRLAMLGLAGGGLATACISLVFYRIIALEKPWAWFIIIPSLLQFLALANSILFVYAAYVGALPHWIDGI